MQPTMHVRVPPRTPNLAADARVLTQARPPRVRCWPTGHSIGARVRDGIDGCELRSGEIAGDARNMAS